MSQRAQNGGMCAFDNQIWAFVFLEFELLRGTARNSLIPKKKRVHKSQKDP